jgi:hypothetical protein
MFGEKPRTIEINGIRCPVDPDFRLMCELSADGADRAEILSRFFFAGLPEGVTTEGAFDGAMKFYREGLTGGDGEESGENGSSLPCFDFGEDEGYFFAAFLSEYGIDLNRAKLHWFDFCALFRGLPDDCRLKQIIGIRAAKTSEIPKHDKPRMMKLKRIYALKKAREKRYESVEERDRAMIEKTKKRYEEVKALKAKKVKG